MPGSDRERESDRDDVADRRRRWLICCQQCRTLPRRQRTPASQETPLSEEALMPTDCLRTAMKEGLVPSVPVAAYWISVAVGAELFIKGCAVGELVGLDHRQSLIVFLLVVWEK